MTQKFTELARGQIGTNKFIVVSVRDDGRLSVAQQLATETDTQPIFLYMKNAISVDEQGLKSLRDIIDTALSCMTTRASI